ncbi:leptin-B-like [Myxocyprinus asiaticus]|uniref:leptin-B-like n=1 Tax=Myxocyprinus asiaticus TaxID=70543 RepID=UPI002222D496|nr:leptin-B-like [Myxocyprinus asiaticus]
MHSSALLYTCILSMLSLSRGVPIRSESLRNLVKLQAETINVRIKEHNEKLNLSPKLLIGAELHPDVPVDKPIQGLSSIVDTLTTFQNILHSLPKGHLSQLHSDVSTLQGYLEDKMKSLQCTSKKTVNEKSLEAFLEDNATHPVTAGYMTLDRLQKFMQWLTVNLDQLKTC